MDRFTIGFLANIPAWLLMNLWSYAAYEIKFSDLRFVDWVSVIIYGKLPTSYAEQIVALGVHLIFTGFLAIIFTFLILEITSQRLWFKGIVYALIVGLFTHAIPVLFRTPHLTLTPLNTTLTDYLGGLIWGVTLAYAINWITKKYKVATPH